jgi:hypothetical protein
LSLLSHLSLEGTQVVVVDHPSVELSPLPGEDSVVDPHLEDSVDRLEDTLELKLINPKPSEMYNNNVFKCPLVSKLQASAVTVLSPSC